MGGNRDDMTLAAALIVIGGCGCQPDEGCACWHGDGEEWTYGDGDADDPELTVIVWGERAYTLTRVQGWYEQRGDADSLLALTVLARAMDAAAKALGDALGSRGGS